MDLDTEERSTTLGYAETIHSRHGLQPHHLYLEVYGRSSYREPEVLLMKAVLEDALHCYYKCISGNTRRERRLFAETREWFFSDNKPWLFSFENICAVLGLSLGYIRCRLSRDKEVRSKSVAFAQRRLLRHRPLNRTAAI